MHGNMITTTIVVITFMVIMLVMFMIILPVILLFICVLMYSCSYSHSLLFVLSFASYLDISPHVR